MIDVTILVSSSPIPSNPSTEIINQMMWSVRGHFPDSKIVIMCDGMPDAISSPSRLTAYSGFKEQIKGRFGNCRVLEFDHHVNQAGMLERGLAEVDTPLLAYFEHDWTFHHGIEWDKIGATIIGGIFNVVRLYMNCRISPFHEGMMFDRVIHDGVPYIHTSQWSQNPHVALTSKYREWADKYVKGRNGSPIEDCLHSPCACGPWENWKVAIYNPIHDSSMGMVKHLDGRQGER